MGTYRRGIIGPFKGAVGTVIGGQWKGIDYIRSRPTTSKRKPSFAQQIQRAKFTLASSFTRSMKTLVMVSFKQGDKMTGANSAMSHTLKNAMVGVYPDLAIDYSLVLVARGQLPNAISPAIVNKGATLQFSWTDNSGNGIARPTDNVILAAYHRGFNHTYYSIGSSVRSAQVASLALPGLKGESLQTWIAFSSRDQKQVSDSIYLGKVALS